MNCKKLKERTGKEGYLYILCTPPEGSGYKMLMLQEGTGDNLLREDAEAGYIDYVNWYQAALGELEIVEQDGGMLLLEKYVRDMPDGLISMIDTVAEDAGIPKDWEVCIL